MKPQQVQRPTTRFERQRLWLLISLGLGSLMVAGVLAVTNGQLANFNPFWWGRTLRGYTGLGLLLGLTSTALAIFTFAYSLRKRVWQETAPPAVRSTMQAWLWAHVYAGGLALVAAFFHAGSGLFTNGLTLGVVLLGLLSLLVFSGLVWRLVYYYVPPIATAKVGNYSQAESQTWAENDLIEIEKLAAGKSPEFQRLKNALLTGQPAHDDAALSDIERDEFLLIRAYAGGRLSNLQRQQQQATFARWLSWWKVLHIPLAGLVVIFFVLHLLWVFDLPAQATPSVAGGFHPAGDCAQCHATIYAQWTQSMHAHALRSPVTIAQTNLVNATTFANPAPTGFCNNCHGPVGARLTGVATLPMTPTTAALQPLVSEGVSCAVCHQFNGEPKSGQGGQRAFNINLRPGRVFFGPFADPVGNAYHQSRPFRFAGQPEQLCKNCHNVTADRNANGEIEKGADLVLQTIFTEWERYQAAGGTQTCVTCHMPVVVDATRAAETAAIPAQQDYVAPQRVVRDHSFVGVDYPLDTVTQADPQRPARQALLQSAATLSLAQSPTLAAGTLQFTVALTNTGAGHNIPGGFAFARQMWLEVTVQDAVGTVLYQSGGLARNTDDLCDANTLEDANNPVLPYIQGCPIVDPQLVNFQQKLVSDVEQVLDANDQVVRDDHGDPVTVQAPTGEEAWLQSADVGSVSRFRPVDGQELDTIDPGQMRQFAYQVPGLANAVGPLTIRVRLLFRNLPPYFLRALAAHQLPTDSVQLAPLIGNVQIVEMAAVSATVK